MPAKPQAMSVRSPVSPSGGNMQFTDLDYKILAIYDAAGEDGVDIKDVQDQFAKTPLTDRVGLLVNTGLLEEMEQENGEPLPNRFCINDWGKKALAQGESKGLKGIQAAAKADALKPRGRGAKPVNEDD